MKEIIVTFPNGDKFSISAKEVALDRTNHYESIGNFGYKSNEWHEEFEYSMQDSILIDWIENDMNWSDVKSYATKIVTEEPDYDKLFTEAEFKIKI